MARKAKGERPVFFKDSQADKLLTMIMTLAGEVSVLRERLDTIERLAETKGLIARQEIEAYRPDEQAAGERDRWRAEYIARVLRVVREELEAIERGEVPESYDAVVRTVSS
jgi:hypothetical protein